VSSTEKSTDKRLDNLKEPWKKGVSGNPAGKKLGQRSYATIYRAALEKMGRAKNMTPEEIEELMEESGLSKAIEGDLGFQKDIKDRIHGKPLQKNEHTGEDGGAIEIIIKRL